MKQDTQQTEAYDLALYIVANSNDNAKTKLAKRFLKQYAKLERIIGDNDNPFNIVVANQTNLCEQFKNDMQNYTETTEVQFRLFRGEVTAVFPYIIESPNNVMCYVHNGQHSVCNWNFNAISKPATPEQYADLYKELESIGYKLKVIKRRNHAKYLQAYKTFINSKTVKK